MKDIAIKFGISTTRVYQILNPSGWVKFQAKSQAKYQVKLKRERAEGIARRADTMDELCIGTKALARRRHYDPEFKKRLDEYLVEETHEEFMMRSRANPDYWKNHW